MRTPGLLCVSRSNPRYFEDASTGRIVYLTGTHTWNDFQDTGSGPYPFDYLRYLEFLHKHSMNFIRLWVLENPRWAPWSGDDGFRIAPVPYARTGPGLAADGQPKFNLDVWNDEYFARLAERVRAAGELGIYVGVMLFSGCSIGNRDWPAADHETGLPVKNPWDSHPYRRDNNVNGLDGDPGDTGQGWELRNPGRMEVLERQKAYVRKAVDVLSDMDNVLFEIANEDPYDTRAWQYGIIEYIHAYESAKPRRHPVGMTATWKQPNEALFESPADWISPYYDEDRALDPLTAGGSKVWIADTDHVFPNMGATMDFVWKAFLRGANVISMDNGKGGKSWEYFRRKAGGNVERYETAGHPGLTGGDFTARLGDLSQMRSMRYAERMDLASATPRNSLSSTGYCLASPGREYLTYQPGEGEFTVDLSAAAGALAAEWLNAVTGETQDGESVRGGRATRFAPPFSPAVLYLKAE
jgi:hypothetical protein